MRPLWSGNLGFGLVNIPVKLISAVQQKELDFDLLFKDSLEPIRYARIDSKTGEEVPWEDIVKGYQYAKGKYVVVTEEDFDKASPQKSKSIDIIQFVKEDQIDPIYYERPYYLVPGKGGEKSYRLLLKALEVTRSVGIAEFVLRNRQHVCALKAYDDMVLLNQMRYQEEIKEKPNLEAVKKQRISAKEIELAVQLIENLTEAFDPLAFKDTYIQELKKVIKAKAAGKQIRLAEPKKPPAATIKDLMSVLKESLNHSNRRA